MNRKPETADVVLALQTRLLAWLGGLMVTQGQGAGERLQVLPWQRRLVLGAFAEGVTTSALSVSRGNGKSTLCAAIAAATLAGPLSTSRGETVIVASSFQQARVGWEHVRAFIEPLVQDEPHSWAVQDSANMARIVYRPTGASVRAVGSDPRRMHGLAPVLVLADEPAQWEPGKADRALAALETAMGKIPGARMVALGTRPADGEHWFAKWLEGGADYVQVHSAAADAPLGRRSTWAKANPSLRMMPALERAIRREAGRAKVDESQEQAFRALRLNQGTADALRPVLLSADVWRACETGRLPAATGPLVLGADLGSSAAMSALAMYWPESGRLETLAAFPERPSLAERGARDHVGALYERLADRGELVTCGARVVDVGGLLALALDRFGAPDVLVADRWREGELRDAADNAGLPPAAVVTRGQGFKDGGEDVRLFRRAAIDGSIRTPVSMLMRAAMAEAVTVSDPAGNSKLAKGSQGGRRQAAKDDAVAAAILAVAEGERVVSAPLRECQGVLAWV